MSDTLWPEDETHRERFEKFHAENPVVYRLFCRFADELLARGRTRYSADAICHRIRWHVAVETTDMDFKINDHYTAFYARLWMKDHPEFGEFFETRRQRSE